MTKRYTLAVLRNDNKKCGKWDIGPLPRNGKIDIPLDSSEENAIRYTDEGLFVSPSKGVEGVKGQDGRDGSDGKDGKDGKDGRDGKDGKDGKSIDIQKTEKTDDGDIEITFSDGSSILVPKGDIGPRGPRGFRGKPGEDIYVEKTEYDADGNTVVTFTTGNTVTIQKGDQPDLDPEIFKPILVDSFGEMNDEDKEKVLEELHLTSDLGEALARLSEDVQDIPSEENSFKWDNESKVITLTGNDGVEHSIDLSQFTKDIHISNVDLDPDTLLLTLQREGDEDLKVDLKELSKSKTKDSKTTSFKGTGASDNPLQVDVNIEETTKEIIGSKSYKEEVKKKERDLAKTLGNYLEKTELNKVLELIGMSPDTPPTTLEGKKELDQATRQGVYQWKKRDFENDEIPFNGGDGSIVVLGYLTDSENSQSGDIKQFGWGRTFELYYRGADGTDSEGNPTWSDWMRVADNENILELLKQSLIDSSSENKNELRSAMGVPSEENVVVKGDYGLGGNIITADLSIDTPTGFYRFPRYIGSTTAYAVRVYSNSNGEEDEQHGFVLASLLREERFFLQQQSFSVLGEKREIYTTANTKVDSDGKLTTGSPIARVEKESIEFEDFNNLFRQEDLTPKYTHKGKGNYEIISKIPLRSDGEWVVNVPYKGGITPIVDYEINQEILDTGEYKITLKTYKQKLVQTLDEYGDMEIKQKRGKPTDVEGGFVMIHFDDLPQLEPKYNPISDYT